MLRLSPFWKSGATLLLCRASHCGTSLVERSSGSGAWARELWCMGASLGPGRTVSPALPGKFSARCPRILSFPRAHRGVAAVWWLLVGSAPSSLCPSGLASSPSAEAAIPGDVTSWFVDVAEIFHFSVFLKHLVVLTVHLQIGPGSLRVWLGLEAFSLSAAPRRQCFLETAAFPRSEFLSPSGPI